MTDRELLIAVVPALVGAITYLFKLVHDSDVARAERAEARADTLQTTVDEQYEEANRLAREQAIENAAIKEKMSVLTTKITALQRQAKKA